MSNGSLLGWIWPSLDARRAEGDGLRRGAVFRHVTPRGTVEIAHVLAVGVDAFNIRHVNFALSFRYLEREVSAGDRTLSASQFLKRYAPVRDPGGASAVEPEPALAGEDDRREPSITIPGPPEN